MVFVSMPASLCRMSVCVCVCWLVADGNAQASRSLYIFGKAKEQKQSPWKMLA